MTDLERRLLDALRAIARSEDVAAGDASVYASAVLRSVGHPLEGTDA